MKKNATIYDISKLANVSIATVSRVVNNGGTVKEATRVKVVEAMNMLRYRPSTSAKAMAERRNVVSLGVLYRFSSSGFFSELLKGIDTGLSASKCLMLSSRLRERPTSVQEIQEYIKHSGVQALLIIYPAMSPEFIEYVKTSTMPIVLVGEPCDEEGVHQVVTDNLAGMRELMEVVVTKNPRPAVILKGPKANREAADRQTATLEVLEEHGLEVLASLDGDFQSDLAQKHLNTFLDGAKNLPPINLICHNDSMAMAATFVLRERGLRIPEDVAITGFDDIEYTEFFGLSTVKVPHEAIGCKATEMAMKLLKYEDVDEKLSIRPEVVIRGSI